MTFESILQVLSGRTQGESKTQLVKRLKNSGEILESKLQTYRRIASAADYYESNEWMHINRQFTNSLEMIGFFRENKTDDNSLSYLTQALWAGGKIPEDKIKEFKLIADAADYYESNEWMHINRQFTNPLEMIEFFREKRTDKNSLSYLTDALWTGGKIPENQLKKFLFIAGAADYYENNEWMHIEKQFTNPLEMIKFLRENKTDGNSLNYLTQALWTGGKIPEDKQKSYKLISSSADYALARRDMIEKQIIHANAVVSIPTTSRRYIGKLMENMDKTLFTYRNNPSKVISKRYLRCVVKYAIELYGSDIIGRN